MAIKVFDRVKETSITSGSGTITLAGASTGFQSFGSVLSSGDQTYYTLVNGNNWEVGLGTYLNSSLARTTVLSSTNGNNLLNLSGNTTAFIAYPAEVSVYRNLSRQVVADTGGILFNDGTILTSANVSVTGTLPTGGSVGQVLVKSGTGNYVSQWAAPSSIIPTGIDAANIANGTVSNTEFQYLDGVTSGIQAQLNLKANTASLTGYYSVTNPSGYATTASLTGYYSSTNPSGFITTGNLSTYVQTTRTLTINGVTQDLSTNRTWVVGDVSTTGSYANPSWITNIAWVKVTGTPTTVAGYGITDAATTGQLSSYYLNSNPSGFATTGQLNNYYLNNNPSGYATVSQLSGYYLNSNPSGYITSSALSPYYLSSNPSGFITAATASGYYLNSNPSGYVNASYVSGYQPLDADLTSLAAASGTGVYYRSASNTWSLITIASPLNFTAGVLSASGLATSGDLNTYYPRTNPSGYAQTASLTGYYSATNPSGFITNSALSGYYPSNNPSGYATTASLTGYYSATNPSGFITNTSLTGYYSITNPSGYITSSSLAGYVPYVGATGNLNLGSNHLQAGSGIFSNSVRIGAYTLPTGDGLTGQVLTTNGVGVVTWTSVSGGSGGSGIASLNGLTNTAQVFSVSTTGVDFNINSAGSTHIFSIPDAGSGVRGVVSTGTQTFNGQKIFDQGIIGSSIPITFNQTWNSGSVTFTGILVNVTNTASNSSSKIIDLKIGNSSYFNIDTVGNFYFGASASNNPVIVGGGAGGQLRFNTQNISGRISHYFDYLGMVTTTSQGAFAWSASTTDATSAGTWDLFQYRDAAGILALRNSTNPQTFRIYNTYTSATNAEWFQESWVSNEIRIGTAVGSSGGVVRNMVFGSWNTAGTWTAWQTFSAASNGSMTNATFDGGTNNYPAIRIQNSVHNAYIAVCQSGQWDSVGIGTQGAATADGTSVNGAIWAGRTGGGLGVYTNAVGTRKWFWDSAGNVTASPVAATSGSPTAFTLTGPAHTTLTASTEATDILFNLGRQVQFASGNITQQRAVRIVPPTYSIVGTGVISSGATLSISGPPMAGSGASITSPYALLVESGNSFFGGQVYITQGVLTSSAPVSISQTWNNASVVFTGIDVNITATAQNVSSNAMTLRQGSTNLVLVRAGSLDTNTVGNSILQVCHPTSYGGHAVLGWRNPFQNGAGVCGDIFNSTSPPTLPSVIAGVIASSRVSTVPSFVITDGTNMAMFWADSGNFVSQRNGTNAQAFRITNTFSSTGNFEAAVIDWQTTPNTLRIGTTQAGAGVARNLQLITSGTPRVTLLGNDGTVSFGDITTKPWLRLFPSGSDGYMELARPGVDNPGLFFQANNTTASIFFATSGAGLSFISGDGSVTLRTTSPVFGGSRNNSSVTPFIIRADVNNARDRDGSDLYIYGGEPLAGTSVNRSGGNVYVGGGRSTGSGLAGSIIIQRCLPGATGTSFNTYSNAVVINSSGFVTIGAYTLPTGDGLSNQVLTTNGSGTVTWQTISSSGGGSGISSLNGLTNSVQTFSVSTTGVDFNINSSGSTHIFSIPDAGSGVRGVVSTGTQTIAGDKTFTGTLIGDANIFSNNTGGTATIGIRNGAGAGNRIQMTYGTGFQMASTYAVTWSPNSSNVNSPDVFLYRDAPGILANRNSTNAQMFRVANTFTSTGNFEAAVIDWQTTTNTLRIGTTQAGTGAARPLQLVTSGVARITVSSSGSVTIGGYTLPTGDGALNQVLTTDGSGTVTWQTVSGSGGSLTGSPSGIVYFNAGGNATSDANLMWNSGTANLNIIGTLTATSKSFLIPHPTSSGKMLQYACLEGPENGVYVRGATSLDFIDLPDYWNELVNDNITVNLTPVGQFQPLYVINKSKSRIVVGGVTGMYDYVVYGERKDIGKLEVEKWA